MVNTSIQDVFYLFEDVFRKKLSKNEIFFCNFAQNIFVCIIVNCQSKQL